MLSKEIKGKTVELPQSWQEVTVAQFCAAYAEHLEEDSQALRDRVKFGLSLSGIAYRDFCGLAYAQQSEIIEAIRFTLETLPEEAEAPVLSWKGKRYVVPANWGAVSMAEWMDLDFYIRKHGAVKSIPYVLAVYFREEGRTDYDTDEAARRGVEWEQMPIGAAWGAACFFSRSAESLQLLREAYSKIEAEAEAKLEQCRHLMKSGAYSGRLPRFVRAILLNLTLSSLKASRSSSAS